MSYPFTGEAEIRGAKQTSPAMPPQTNGCACGMLGQLWRHEQHVRKKICGHSEFGVA
jgi:hypothetical protein